MDTEQLRRFLLKSNEAGYASGDERQWVRETDGSWTIVFEHGPWKSHDNFFGGEPYGGRTVVFHEGEPIWLLVYYGWVDEASDPKQLYDLLKKALKQMPADAPYRGPARYEERGFVYSNEWDGPPGRFSGREEIRQGGGLLYRADYAGRLGRSQERSLGGVSAVLPT